jgi:hypothetical protein
MNFLVVLVTGPFYFFRFSFVQGAVALLAPLTGLAVAFQILFEGDMTRLQASRPELLLWLAIYWTLCVLLALVRSADKKKQSFTPSPSRPEAGHSKNIYQIRFPV